MMITTGAVPFNIVAPGILDKYPSVQIMRRLGAIPGRFQFSTILTIPILIDIMQPAYDNHCSCSN